MRLLLLVGFCVSSSTMVSSSEVTVVDADTWVKHVLAGPFGLAANADLDRARADVDAAGLWANPSLRLERQSGPLLDQSKGSQDFLAVEVPLTLSGRLGVAKDAAVRRADAAAFDVKDGRARVARAALDVFVDVVSGNRRRHALEEERARLAPVVVAARMRADAGETAAAVAIRLELELARVDDEVAAARADVEGAKRRADALVAGIAPAFADTFPTTPPTTPTTTPAAVSALDARAAAAALDEDAASRRIIPDVVVGGGPALLNTGSPDFAVGYLVTVGIDLPFFDRGQGDAGRARAERRALDAERAALTAQKDGARADAKGRAAAARARADAFAIAVNNSASLFDAAARDLGVGSGDVVAFVDAAATIRQARVQLVALQEASARAEIELSFLVGALASSPESTR